MGKCFEEPKVSDFSAEDDDEMHDSEREEETHPERKEPKPNRRFSARRPL